VAGETKADGGTIRSAVRWGLVLAAVATLDFGCRGSHMSCGHGASSSVG